MCQKQKLECQGLSKGKWFILQGYLQLCVISCKSITLSQIKKKTIIYNREFLGRMNINWIGKRELCKIVELYFNLK